MNRSSTVGFVVSAVVVHFFAASAKAQCPCNGDVFPVGGGGGITFDDILAVVGCECAPIAGACAAMDINCDGVIDAEDGEVVLCLFGGGGPAACCPPCAATFPACDDGDVCTYDECVTVGAASSCANTPTIYGDANGDCLVNLVDILLVLSGFSSGIAGVPNADIAPICAGDGLVSLGDILGVLAAFTGFDPCGGAGACPQVGCCCAAGC
jgi:hypothetical protein